MDESRRRIAVGRVYIITTIITCLTGIRHLPARRLQQGRTRSASSRWSCWAIAWIAGHSTLVRARFALRRDRQLFGDVSVQPDSRNHRDVDAPAARRTVAAQRRRAGAASGHGRAVRPVPDRRASCRYAPCARRRGRLASCSVAGHGRRRAGPSRRAAGTRPRSDIVEPVSVRGAGRSVDRDIRDGNGNTAAQRYAGRHLDPPVPSDVSGVDQSRHGADRAFRQRGNAIRAARGCSPRASPVPACS